MGYLRNWVNYAAPLNTVMGGLFALHKTYWPPVPKKLSHNVKCKQKQNAMATKLRIWCIELDPKADAGIYYSSVRFIWIVAWELVLRENRWTDWMDKVGTSGMKTVVSNESKLKGFHGADGSTGEDGTIWQ